MSIKTLSIPILLKNYIGKNRKFCITTGIAPLFIFSVYKKDWVAALADQPGQELLKETIYKNNAIYRPNKKLYDYYLDPKHKSDRDAFYKIWENRKEKEKRTYLSVSSVFNGRIGLELAPLGIEYEADGGFILHWDVLHFSFFGKSNVALSSIFSIGYNLNKLLHYDIHHKNKAERSHH